MSTDRESLSASLRQHPLTDEQWRILRAIERGDMWLNDATGRWYIVKEERPDRKSRERLRGRGLIAPFGSSAYRLTARGKAALEAFPDA